jgi:pimeloyl-ACP methyl ester carboxylesterase
MDKRIAAAVVSHTGAGKIYRYAGEKYGSQTLEVRTRLFPHMSHPRLRFFCGRENKLPFDGHYLLSLVAPRALLITEGDRDPVGELVGVQEAFRATQQVYALLEQPERLNAAIDPGGHTLSDAAMERWLDWLDLQLGRRAGHFEDQFVYNYTFGRWRDATGAHVDVEAFPERGLDDLLTTADGTPIATPDEWQGKRDEIEERMLWMLGDLPACETLSPLVLVRQQVYDRYFGFRTEGGLVTERMALDAKLVCYLTYREQSLEQTGPLPVAIYCHQYNAQRGFAWQRHEQAGINVGERLAYKGFLAVEYDQFGYGTRNHDSSPEFFVSHPGRSALGVMVQDVRRIVDALSLVPTADASRIALVGYALGGAVALHAAALNARIRAVASVCGFASMRLDAHGPAIEGLGRYCRIRPLLPRLGFFCDHERRVPYDYHEVLALIAPRPALVFAPLLDQDWFPEDVTACYDAAREVYRLLGTENRLALRRPYDFNRYPPKHQDEVNDWLLTSVQA